jgi:hypothetical protein
MVDGPDGSSEIVIESEVQKWRLECPEGHHNWRVWDGVFSCRTCHEQLQHGGDVETSLYERLVDTRTGDPVTREDLDLRVNIGQPMTVD